MALEQQEPSMDPYVPWDTWRDGMPLNPPGCPAYRTVSSDQWIAFRPRTGAGWLMDGVMPYPPGDITPVPPAERPRGPSYPLSIQSGVAYLQSQGHWPPPPPEAQLAAQAEQRRQRAWTWGTQTSVTSTAPAAQPPRPSPPEWILE
jgi:hypothetical protein